MIEPDETIFPANVVKWVSSAMRTIDPDITVIKRSLRNTDPAQSVGVSAMMWSPDDNSLEMDNSRRPGPQEPTIQQYTFAVQAFVKNSSEEEGLNVHAVLSQRVRSVLYTDPNLQLLLGALKAELPGDRIEAVTRWGVRTVRYFGNEVSGAHLYLSTLEFWVETETRG